MNSRILQTYRCGACRISGGGYLPERCATCGSTNYTTKKRIYRGDFLEERTFQKPAAVSLLTEPLPESRAVGMREMTLTTEEAAELLARLTEPKGEPSE